jgi:ribosomal protein S18 acetylase RimI-like enzyme
MKYKTRVKTLEDIPCIRDLMRGVYQPPLHGPEAIWSEQNLVLHISRFPEGQIVSIDTKDGKLVGTSTSMMVSMEKAIDPHTWSEISGSGTISTHDPSGDVLYGINIAVDPDYQGRGVASALYKARFNLARKMGCRAFIAGARIPGYLAYADQLAPEQYLEKVKLGQLFDPTLSKQIKLGFQVIRLLADYSSDSETLNYAALIQMEL